MNYVALIFLKFWSMFYALDSLLCQNVATVVVEIVSRDIETGNLLRIYA